MSKFKLNYTIIALLLIALTLLMVGMSILDQYSKTSFATQNKEPLKIGATYMTLNNPFFAVIDDEIRKNIESNGDVLISLDPALDNQKQLDQIYYLIERGVDIIILNPVDFTGLKPALKAAKEANIPIITVDTEVVDDEFVRYSIMSDNYSAGIQCAKDMMKRKSSADIVLLQHSTAYSAVQRIQGFVDTIAKHSEYKVVARIECEGQLEKTMPLMLNFLDEGIPFDVVMALNDPSAMGALAALQSEGELERVLVYGVDGTPETKALIKENMMQGTVAQSPKEMGKKAIETAYKIMKGKAHETKERIPVTLITKENIHRYSIEGWQ